MYDRRHRSQRGVLASLAGGRWAGRPAAMSCRWTCGAAAGEDPRATDSAVIYLELARERRREDFAWFAMSQGVPPETVEALWQGVLARLGRTGAIGSLTAGPP